MSNRPIHYEPHPVSRERKAELIAAGFRIVDAKFKPKVGFHKELAGGGIVGVGTVAAPERAEQLDEKPADDVAPAQMSVELLKAALTSKGIAFRSNASRASLVALLTKEA